MPTSHQQFTNDEQRPAFGKHLERLRDRAILTVSNHDRTPLLLASSLFAFLTFPAFLCISRSYKPTLGQQAQCSHAVPPQSTSNLILDSSERTSRVNLDRTPRRLGRQSLCYEVACRLQAS